MITFLNDEFVQAEKAFLHISDLSIQRGYGIFDFLRVMDNHPLYLPDYLNRFYNSASEMRLELSYSQQEFGNIIHELIQRNNMPLAGIKIILTGGYSEDGFHLAKPNLIIAQQPLKLPSDKISDGIKVITHEFVRDLPHVKSINYLMGIWVQKKMKEQSAQDVLYHIGGEVSEFPRCNFFIVTKDNTLVTPVENILHGITRKNILLLAAKKFNVKEGAISLNDIANAKEAFLTSTTKRIIPITRVDDHTIGTGQPGPVATELFEDLVQWEKNN